METILYWGPYFTEDLDFLLKAACGFLLQVVIFSYVGVPIVTPVSTRGRQFVSAQLQSM